MIFDPFAEDRPAADPSNNNGDFASSVTEQFKFMHVSGNGGQHQKTVEDLAKSLMSTLGINDFSNPAHSEQLEKLMGQLNGMVITQPTLQPPQVSNPTFSTNHGAAFAAPTATSKSPKKNESRRHRIPRQKSRSRSPLARFAKGLRSMSPRRHRNHEKPKSPLASQANNNSMATDTELDEFFEAHSTMDSFAFDSPNPKQQPKPTNSAHKQRAPTPPTNNVRPPLATVHISELKTHNGNSPILSPQQQSSTFRFDKEQDKFHLGSSPPKKSKFGSPGKKSRSPRSSPPAAQPHQANDTPLQGSPLTEGEQPSPFVPSVKPPQTNVGGAPAPFASPVPDVFHAPETFIRSSGSRGIPTPHNIMQHNDDAAAARRQTAPATMSTAAAAAAASFSIPKTPFDAQANTGIPNIAPDTSDTAETLIKKKTRNTATPNLGAAAPSPKFNVDLSHNPNKAKGKRGNTLRKGFGSTNATTGRSSFVFGLDEIKETGTDETAPTEAESPSNGSAVFMDTSPIFSPKMPQHNNNSQRTNTATANANAGAPVQFNMGVGDTKSRTKRKENKRRGQVPRSQSATANVYGPSRSTFDLNHAAQNQQQLEMKLSNIRTEIINLKEMGKACYLEGKYQESTRVYGQAIEKFKFELFAHVACKDLLAVLLSNRAAALLMIGAYESAVEDCKNGILYVTDPRNTNLGTISPDANPTLRPKIYTRMGKSYLKLGKVDDADRAFSGAISSATAIQGFHQRQNVVGMHNGLEHIKTDAMMGQTDVSRLRRLFVKIQGLEEQRRGRTRNARDNAMECLGLVNVALNTANGCHELHKTKVELLAELHRWRELRSHCERFAASNVKYDGCLIGDLAAKNPFPGVTVARYLRADYFDDAKEDDIKGIETVLNKKPAAEALLRLPYLIMPYYLRSLRLNENYHVEEYCLAELDKYINERIEATKNRDFIVGHFLWLGEERAKMQRTRIERGIADDLFTDFKYEEAASRYAECLTIDSGGNPNSTGCRLHAVLHCNRAACFMMMKTYRDAMTECTAALRIYPRYVKALLRRARCYSRLERTREAVNDYNHWIDLVKHSRGNSKYNPVLSDLVFDGPQTIKDKEFQSVQAELKDVLEAKAKAEADEVLRQARNSFQQQSRQYHSERFHYNGNKSPAHDEAHRRRENFYSSQNGSRRWDSFKDRTQSSRQEKPKAQKNRPEDYGYKSKSSSSPGGGYNSKKSHGSPRDSNDHYTVLGIDRRATAEEIKKAYKKMALKYHPDKNKDNPTAADNFLRIKDAYETLKDPSARRKYDATSRRRRY